MDKMFKLRYETAKQDTIDFKKEIHNMKTFYPDDPNLSDLDKDRVEKTYHLFKVIRKLLKTFADNSKCKRGLYVAKIEPQIDQCFAEAKSASLMWQRMLVFLTCLLLVNVVFLALVLRYFLTKWLPINFRKKMVR